MLYLKLMSHHDLPDASPNKNFEIIPISDTTDIRFVTQRTGGVGGVPDGTMVSVVLSDESRDMRRQITLSGNAYVLNESGKTIASHAPY
jgi:hypothetical protein